MTILVLYGNERKETRKENEYNIDGRNKGIKE
jgi:hypothetical protein